MRHTERFRRKLCDGCGGRGGIAFVKITCANLIERGCPEVVGETWSPAPRPRRVHVDPMCSWRPVMTDHDVKIGRRALLSGAAMTAVAAAAQAQNQGTAEPVTTLADVPLSPATTITVERRGDIVLVGINRPFIQNRIDPPTRLRLGEVGY